MMIGIVLTNGEQTPLADQIIAALILDPMQFTIKKITRDKTLIHTILCSERKSESIKDIEDLKSNSLNNYKLQLYKTILDIITRHSDPAYVVDMMEQEGSRDRKPIRAIPPKKTGPLRATEIFGGKKRTKKRNHKRTTNEEPKRKQRTRKQKRHSMTSDR